jgi:GTP-binding protein HflX
MGAPFFTSDRERESVFLVGIQFRNQPLQDVEDSLQELAALTDTAGATVAGRVIFRESQFHPATLIGKGKAEQLAAQVGECGATTVVFDDDLSPAQGRNLSVITQAKIIDRTQLILHIFAQHAQTRAGRLQIEFAQLQYLLPRLRRRWTHLERQQGGIGLRGPGEKQLELDRRRIEDRLHRIRQELERVIQHRTEQRRGRRRHGWALIVLVGYTNAGKSTLLNALTGAAAKADDQLFATLDPLTRKLKLPNRQSVLLTDTVGFIRKLPHHLVEAFKATLEEVSQADLLLHVVDASHPRAEQQMESVRGVLRDLNADSKPTLHVLNKMDRPEAVSQAAWLRERVGRHVEVSALTGQGMDALSDEIADFLRMRNTDVTLRFHAGDGRRLSLVRSAGKVYEQVFTEDGDVILRASVPIKLREQLRDFLVTE